MRIRINNKQREIGSSAIQQAKAKIEAAFSKFGPKVISVELLVEDINGPKGGVDKKCRIVVKLQKMDNVVVSAQEEAYSKAISRAIRRAERAAGRKIQRRAKPTQRRTMLELSIYG